MTAPFKSEAILSDPMWFNAHTRLKYSKKEYSRSVSLPIYHFLLTLPWIQELLLLLIPTSVVLIDRLLLEQSKPIYSVGIPIISLIGIVLYFYVRNKLTSKRYQMSKGGSIEISSTEIKVPFLISASHALNSIKKSDVSKVEVFWAYVRYSNSRENRVMRVNIKLSDGSNVLCEGLAIPVKSILYFMVKFGYPVVFEEIAHDPGKRLKFILYGLTSIPIFLLLYFLVLN